MTFLESITKIPRMDKPTTVFAFICVVTVSLIAIEFVKKYGWLVSSLIPGYIFICARVILLGIGEKGNRRD